MENKKPQRQRIPRIVLRHCIQNLGANTRSQKQIPFGIRCLDQLSSISPITESNGIPGLFSFSLLLVLVHRTRHRAERDAAIILHPHLTRIFSLAFMSRGKWCLLSLQCEAGRARTAVIHMSLSISMSLLFLRLYISRCWWWSVNTSS